MKHHILLFYHYYSVVSSFVSLLIGESERFAMYCALAVLKQNSRLYQSGLY